LFERSHTHPTSLHPGRVRPFAWCAFARRTSRIVTPDGSVVFELKNLLDPT